MFGYVVINKPELKIREFEEYKSFYCGLCRVLKDEYGIKGQLTLNYDMTFLCMLLSGLYDNNIRSGSSVCIAHPFEKHNTIITDFTKYAADMNILLTYYQCIDDWNDDRSVTKKIFSEILKKSGIRVAIEYPEQSSVIETELKKLSEYEKQGVKDIDKVSGCFGRLMACIFTYRHDEWEKYLYDVGFYLGKYIYLLDAYRDYDNDIKKNKYNPLSEEQCNPQFCKETLTMLIAKCCSSYEMLPIVEYDEILKNILYAGVWTGFSITGREENK